MIDFIIEFPQITTEVLIGAAQIGIIGALIGALLGLHRYVKRKYD